MHHKLQHGVTEMTSEALVKLSGVLLGNWTVQPKA